jgi:5S rRNA maturation endonuclease (ribonuclease M5)
MTDTPLQRSQRVADTESVENLEGVPSGLLAYPVYLWRIAEDGTPLERVDHRAREFVLRPRNIPTDDVIRDMIHAAPERLDMVRRGWADLRRRHRTHAAPLAVGLANDGLVELTAAANRANISVLGTISGWQPTPLVQDFLDQRLALNTQARDTTTAHAAAAAAALRNATVECDVSSLLAAIETHTARARPNVRIVATLTAAAEALSTGDIYAGKRAFSQRHFDDSKEVDADQILAAAGVSDDIRRHIGVYRYGTIDIAGLITVTSREDPGATACLRGFPGPWSLPADRERLCLTCSGAVLVVIENKDPAQHLSRTRPDLAVWYLSGYSGPTQLEMLKELAATAREIIAITDADAHGVLIASQVLEAVDNARIVDLGTHPHKPRKRPMDKTAATALLGDLMDDQSAPSQLREFARAVMSRGYDVEQDDMTDAALDHLLP